MFGYSPTINNAYHVLLFQVFADGGRAPLPRSLRCDTMEARSSLRQKARCVGHWGPGVQTHTTGASPFPRQCPCQTIENHRTFRLATPSLHFLLWTGTWGRSGGPLFHGQPPPGVRRRGQARAPAVWRSASAAHGTTKTRGVFTLRKQKAPARGKGARAFKSGDHSDARSYTEDLLRSR